MHVSVRASNCAEIILSDTSSGLPPYQKIMFGANDNLKLMVIDDNGSSCPQLVSIAPVLNENEARVFVVDWSFNNNILIQNNDSTVLLFCFIAIDFDVNFFGVSSW